MGDTSPDWLRSWPARVGIALLGAAYCVLWFIGLTKVAAVLSGGHVQRPWLGVLVLLGCLPALLQPGRSWLTRVGYSLFGLWFALQWWLPYPRLAFQGPLFCGAAAFTLVGWRREGELRPAAERLSWTDVRRSLALGGRAVAVVVAVVLAGGAYAAVWLVVAHAMGTPAARAATAAAFIGVLLVGTVARRLWRASRRRAHARV